MWRKGKCWLSHSFDVNLFVVHARALEKKEMKVFFQLLSMQLPRSFLLSWLCLSLLWKDRWHLQSEVNNIGKNLMSLFWPRQWPEWTERGNNQWWQTQSEISTLACTSAHHVFIVWFFFGMACLIMRAVVVVLAAAVVFLCKCQQWRLNKLLPSTIRF